MEEKRKSRRMELEATLKVKKLGGGESEEVSIETIDLSKTGIGFLCEKELETGGVYEANLVIWTKETIHCFIEIVRAVDKGDRFFYGGVFIGMPETDIQRISVYETVSTMNEEEK